MPYCSLLNNRFGFVGLRRCRKLPLGQEADRLHWFPKSMEISDATEEAASDS